MKKYVLVLSLCLIAGVIIAGEWGKTVKSAKSFTTSATTVDTCYKTGTTGFDISGKEMVELGFSIFGNDSVRTDIYVDGLVGGKWINFVHDSLKLVDATANLGRTVLLRGYGTNKIPGTNEIRIIISNQAGNDSTSLEYYNCFLTGR